MKLISIAQLHPCMHTQKQIKGTTSRLSKSNFPTVSSLWILPFLYLKSFFLHAFRCSDFHIDNSYICMMEYQYLRQHRDALCFPTSSPTGLKPGATHTARQPCSLIPGSWHCAHCDWQASRRWSYTVRHNVVQWSLEGTMGLLVWSVCDSVRLLTADKRRWAGTGQAQCLHKHIDIQTDIHTHTNRPVVQLAV